MRKYKKAWLCKHATLTGMVINHVDEGCPHKVMLSGVHVIEKMFCRECQSFEEREVEKTREG